MASERPGLCMVCGRPGKLYTCSLCGSLVCSEHYDITSGLCSNCRRGRRMARL